MSTDQKPAVGQKPAIAITMGDPCGIGPEVVVKAMADPQVYRTCRPLVVGNVYAMEQAVSLTGVSAKINETSDPAAAGLEPGVIDVVDIHNLNPEDITVGQINPICGKAAMEWVTKAGELALGKAQNKSQEKDREKESLYKGIVKKECYEKKYRKKGGLEYED